MAAFLLLAFATISLTHSGEVPANESPQDGKQVADQEKAAAQKVVPRKLEEINAAEQKLLLEKFQQFQQQKQAVQAQALKRAGPTTASQRDETPPVFPPPDRFKLQILRRSLQALDEEQFTIALQGLTHLLEMDEDFFYKPQQGVGIYRSMKYEAKTRLAELPEKARALYEDLYGSIATRELEAAVSEKNTAALESITRRFPHTTAAARAAYLLAGADLDHGQFFQAAMRISTARQCPDAITDLEPNLSLMQAWALVRAGETDAAREVLAIANQQFQTAVVLWNGERLSLAEAVTNVFGSRLEEPPPTRLFDWLTFGGEGNRNRATPGSLPLGNPTWRHEFSAPPKVRDAVVAARGKVADRGDALIPSFHPLVVDDLVIARGLDNEITALDAATGQMRWKTGFRPSGKSFLPAASFMLASHAPLEDRLWFDGVAGQLSSDGDRIYAVEESWNPMAAPLAGGKQGLALRGLDGTPVNRLAAYDIVTEGKLLWSLSSEDSRLGSKSSVYFLGAPLAANGELFVLGETPSGDVSLFALDGASGGVKFTQLVVTMETTGQRRGIAPLAGAQVACEGNLVICPTGAGSMVAFDRSMRTLAWGYTFESKLTSANAKTAAQATGSGLQTWRVSVPRIHGGRVFLTPQESDEVHCLRLSDGQLLWKKPRLDGLFLAGVQNGLAIIVGRSTISALNVEDGMVIWEEGFPNGIVPSGLGYLNGATYFQPLSGQGIVAFDLQSGAEVATTRPQRHAAPGNLVAMEDCVISQTPYGLERFPCKDAVALNDNALLVDWPDEKAAEQLAILAEMRLLDGDIRAAVELLQTSLARNRTASTREMLFDAYLLGLHQDFAAFRESATQIEDLIASPRERAAYTIALADGLAAGGEHAKAFAAYLDVPRLDDDLLESGQQAEVSLWPRDTSPQNETGDVRMSNDAYISWRLAQLRAKSNEEQKRQIEASLRDWIAPIRTATDRDRLPALERAMHYLPQGESSAEFRLQWLRQSAGSLGTLSPERLLEREGLLEELSFDESPEVAAAAVASLARHYRELRCWALVQRQIHRLQEDFSDVICLADQTGAEFARHMASNLPVNLDDHISPNWPAGAMNARQLGSNMLTGSEYTVDWEPAAGSALEGWSLRLAHPANTLIGIDDVGETRFQCNLTPYLNQPRSFRPYHAHRAWSLGHLLLYETGAQVFAIDVYAAREDQVANVLWHQDLVRLPSDKVPSFPIFLRQWGKKRPTLVSPDGHAVLPIGLIHGGLYCGILDNTLIAFDPYTGKRIWARRDVSEGSVVYGDRQRLIVNRPNRRQSQMLDSANGAEVGSRPAIREENVMLTRNGAVLVWERASMVNITLFDKPSRQQPSGEATWKYAVPGGSKAHTLGELLVIVQPDWRYHLIRIKDGAVLAKGAIPEAAIPKDASLDFVTAFHSNERIVIAAGNLLTSHNEGDVRRNAVADGSPNTMFTGPIIGLSHPISPKAGEPPANEVEPNVNGGPLWAVPVQAMTILRSQPRAVPLFSLACRVYDRGDTGVQRQRTAVMLIDTRDGAVVFDDEISGLATAFRTESDSRRQSIRLRLNTASLEVRFGESDAEGSD